MDTSDIEETTPIIPKSGILPQVRDPRRPYEKQLAIYLILASILFERVAFYSLAANLVVSLQSTDLLHWGYRNSLAASFIFSGISYLSTLIFAAISDAKLGRARTIIIGFVLYLIGYTLITITATGDTPLCRNNATTHLDDTSIDKENCAPTLLGTLIITSIGAGAVKSNMAVFGAEQIQESKITSRYFEKYMVAVNIGSIIATLAIPFIQDLSPHYIGYLVAASMLFLAAMLFIIGYRYYIHVESNETVITKCIPVFINAFQTWYRYNQAKRSIERKHKNSSKTSLVSDSHSLIEREDSMRIDERPSTFLDFANIAHGGKFYDRIIHDVKSLRSAIVVFSLLIPYWLIYHQIHTTFPQQGRQMQRPDIKHIITWMSLGDSVTIIIGILILNVFVYKYMDDRNRTISLITKFVIGMIFALITMCIAGAVEMIRQHYCDSSTLSPSEISNLTIFAQLPQNIGMGVAELFATVASYEFAYFAAPRSAQSLFMSLHFCSAGVSSFINTAYTYVFPTSKVELDFNCQKKEWYWSFYTYFFILAGLQLLFVIILIVCHKKFRIVKPNPQQTERNHFVQ